MSENDKELKKELNEVEDSFNDEPIDDEPRIATKDDIDGIIDAMKELTSIVKDFSDSFEKWRRAGKF